MTESTHTSLVSFDFENSFDMSSLVDESTSFVKEQTIAAGKITDINKDFVTVDIGFKSEGKIPVEQFRNEDGELLVEIGEETEVYIEAFEDYDGVALLSKEKAHKQRVWENVTQIYESEGTIEGTIIGRIKGGLSVNIGVKAFLPGSQIDLRPVRNLDQMIGENL